MTYAVVVLYVIAVFQILATRNMLKAIESHNKALKSVYEILAMKKPD